MQLSIQPRDLRQRSVRTSLYQILIFS